MRSYLPWKVLGYTAIRLEHKPVIYWQLIYGKTFFLQRTMIAFNIFNESYILYTVHVYKHIHTSNDYPNYSRHAMHYIIAINNILFLPFCLLMKLFFPLSVETNLLKCSHPLKPFMSFLRHTAEILLPPWTCVYRTYKTDECPLSCAAAVGGSDLELSNKEKKMNSKDESSHVWPTSADHDQNTAQVKDGLFQLTVGNSV